MEFLIAETFTDSLAKLSGQEQNQVKITTFDLQTNPTAPGLSFHRLDRSKDPNFWSVRVSRDLRIIVHKTASSMLLCYVGHHDDAYRWAERRKLETHPKTGAAQLVEVRERVQEIVIPQYVVAERPAPAKPRLFDHLSDDDLLSYGVPPEWLDDVRVADEDSILELADHLPAEAAEALLEIATGGKPEITPPVPAGEDPFQHPDALRRFRVMSNIEELQRALDYPWEKWAIFLHPAQRALVERDFNGPARVSGSAGTGKTVVALHRAVHLARTNPGARVLLVTFSDPLAHALQTKLRRLIAHEPLLGEQLQVLSMQKMGEGLFRPRFGPPNLIGKDELAQLIADAAAQTPGRGFPQRFLMAEWEQVVDAWQLTSWEDYRDVKRLGRRTRLSQSQRQELWAIYEQVRSQLRARNQRTISQMFTQLAEHFAGGEPSPYDFIVVDEAQDISVAQLRLLAAMGLEKPNGLFFAGDLGQRIFQQPFSWKSLGVDIRGRSRTLRICYRTSHQIRMQADRLLDPSLSDLDGNVEDRRGTISIFNGPPPDILEFDTADEEIHRVGQWLRARAEEGVAPREMGVFVRTEAELPRARAAVEETGLAFKVLDEEDEPEAGRISISTMHLAKGLEFRAVAVMACDDGVIPLEARIEAMADMADMEEVYNTERQLLYVACTRARDHLLVSGVSPVSEFIDDLRM
jgi:superfamily I DNA/RNA helicase/mRNA-degrading endonuclease RelE of RelBE toxin-antitoxin system